MDWLWTAALVPFLLCGSMCLGSIAVAAMGARRMHDRRTACCGDDDVGGSADRERPVR